MRRSTRPSAECTLSPAFHPACQGWPTADASPCSLLPCALWAFLRPADPGRFLWQSLLSSEAQLESDKRQRRHWLSALCPLLGILPTTWLLWLRRARIIGSEAVRSQCWCAVATGRVWREGEIASDASSSQLLCVLRPSSKGSIGSGKACPGSQKPFCLSWETFQKSILSFRLHVILP